MARKSIVSALLCGLLVFAAPAVSQAVPDGSFVPNVVISNGGTAANIGPEWLVQPFIDALFTNYIAKTAGRLSDGVLKSTAGGLLTNATGGVDYEPVFRYFSMPTPNVSTLGQIVLFVGTTGTYENGRMYRCDFLNPGYGWVAIGYEAEIADAVSNHNASATSHLSVFSEKVDKTTTINGYSLSNDVDLVASDVGAISVETDPIATKLAQYGTLDIEISPASDFTFTTNSGFITITGLANINNLTPVIPYEINGKVVNKTAAWAFSDYPLTSVTYPICVTNVGIEAYSFPSPVRTVSSYFTRSGSSIVGYDFELGGENVVIPHKIDGVLITSIGEGCFAHNTISTVLAPRSITTIGSSAFEFSSLTSISLPNVTTIGGFAFADTSLTSVSLPNATTIGGFAFAGSSLTSVSLPNATTIGSSTFGSTPLTSISLPNATTIGSSAFEFSSLTSVSLPNVTTIGDSAFYGTSLTSISLPNVTTIGSSTFGSTPLTSISLPNATTIGDYAFADTSLTSVSLPNVTTIGNSAFGGSTYLTSISLPNVTTIGDSAFYGTPLTSISLPNATTIGDYAFLSTYLTSISLPNVTTIGDSAFGYSSLTSVFFGKNKPSIGGTDIYIDALNVTNYVLTGTTGWGATFPPTGDNQRPVVVVDDFGLVTNNIFAKDIKFAGDIDGNGIGLTNVNAKLLDGYTIEEVTNSDFYDKELLVNSSGATTTIPITPTYRAYKVVVTNSTDIVFGGISSLNLVGQFPTLDVRLVITDPAVAVTLPASGVGGVYYPEAIDLTTTITNTTHYLSVRPYATNDVMVTRWLYREP